MMWTAYKLNEYNSLMIMESIAACGEIEEVVNDKVSKVERDDSWVTISFQGGGGIDMSPEEYRIVCEDYNMTRMTKGTKIRAYFGRLSCVAFIMN